MFDNRFVVESPGKLPGLVRLDNIRKIHFSRNPKIAEFLKNYTYVKEFGEGIDRMYTLLEEEGLPEPKYESIAFMLKVTVWNRNGKDEPINEPIKLTKAEKTILLLLNNHKGLSTWFFKCGGGKLSWHVLETGDVTPCAFIIDNYFSLGNIKNKDYVKLVENEEHFKKIEDKWFRNINHINNLYHKRNEDFSSICDCIVSSED